MSNFIVSARKYRPSIFDAVVGQSSITSTLKNAIEVRGFCTLGILPLLAKQNPRDLNP